MKTSRRTLFLFSIGLLFAAGLMTVLLPQADAEGLKDRGRAKTAALAAATADPGGTAVVINETDADQAGTDAAEFVELKSSPNTSLNGFVLVMYNGSTDLSYAAYDLDGLTTDANGLVLIGNTGMSGVDLILPTNGLQNDNDAVALYLGDAANYPVGSTVSTANLVDAVVYDTSDPDDTGLLALLNPGAAQVQVNENEYGSQVTHSVRRCSDATRDGRAFSVGLPTPNALNSNCPDGIVDIDGDGKTDPLIARPVGGAAAAATSSYSIRFRGTMRERLKMRAEAVQDTNAVAGGGVPMEWWGFNSSNSSVSTAVWGDFAADSPLTADFDGDGKDDFTVWRTDTDGTDEGSYWYSLDSSTFTARQVHFGGKLDNPIVVGDYDGDGIDDPAVFRCPQFQQGTCYFYYRPSSMPNTGDWAVAWGFGEAFDLLPYPGDFNGDGKQDFAVQQQSPTNPGTGIFYITINGTFEFSSAEWGAWPSDRLVSGDFDGDGKSDITVTRVDQNDVLWWYVLERDGGMRFVPWGNGLDWEAPGDYDGDGQDDFGVFRENITDATYWILPSNGASHFAVTWGQPGDTPLQNVFVQ